MTDAVITDIAPYQTKDTIVSNASLSEYSDARVAARHTLLEIIAKGGPEGAELTDTSNPIVRAAFPTGFDPKRHPEDNVQAVYDEAIRRGVFVKSR